MIEVAIVFLYIYIITLFDTEWRHAKFFLKTTNVNWLTSQILPKHLEPKQGAKKKTAFPDGNVWLIKK
jgi:Ca2+/H+ antiporter